MTKVRLLLLLAAVTPVFAQFTPVNTPTGSYTSSTTVIPIVGADNTSVGSITNGVQTVTFSQNLDIHSVGVPGGGWSTWGAPPNTETATPRVVGTYLAVTSFTMSLAAPSYTFGFEFEPDTFSTFSITATFMNGATTLGTITRSINGSSGALLMASSATTPITSVVLTVPSGANGFAVAQVRYSTTSPTASVPALNTTGMCGLGGLLAAAGALLARKQQLAS